MDPEGSCARCGRKLTHPGSILIGIGPECLGDWGARDRKLDNMTEADKQYLRDLIGQRVVNQWIPKSIIKKVLQTDSVVTAPSDHKMLVPEPKPIPTQRAVNPLGLDTTPPPPSKTQGGMKVGTLDGKIKIEFPYNQDTVNKVRTLNGRKYDPTGKFWTCPVEMDSILKLKGWGFVITEEIEKLLSKEQSVIKAEVEKKMDDHSRALAINFSELGLKKTLFPFQEEGVAFIEAKGGRALIGDEMGLGKTIQALAWLQLHPEVRPAVIVVPASLKLNWAKEIRNTITRKVNVGILEGRSTGSVWLEDYDIIIINYDILEAWLEEILRMRPQVVIADEAHYFKSNQAKRTKAMKRLVKAVPHFLALTGTPIMNRPIEIYNAIAMVNPKVIPPFWDFAKRYCGAKHNGYGWDFNGATNTEELHEILTKSIMIRRKKADVLKDLPDKRYNSIPMKLDNQSEYESAEGSFIDWVRETKGDVAADKASNAEILTQIEALKQVAVKGKMNASIEWIEDFLESGEKLVVFAIHKFVIDQLMTRFGNIAVKIDGSVSTTDRDKAVTLFQTNDAIKLFVGNIQAAGVGLTLTAASNVAFLEYPWTPGAMRQAEDRCHRIGQKFSVMIHLLIAHHTIDEEIAELLDSKTKVLAAVLDGEEVQQESLLRQIIKLTTKK